MTSVKLDIDDQGIAWVTLARPEKHNALDMTMFKSIDKTISQIKQHKHVRVVILNGSGVDFCTGLDIKSVMVNKSNAIKLLFKVLPFRANLAQKISYRWQSLNVPVIAAIHGRCWGGGMQIALGADFRIATPDASMSIMEAKWGLIPDMAGNKPLSQLVPIDQAKKLVMTAEILSGEQALAHNLVTELSADPNEAAKAFAEKLLQTSPDVLKHCKHLYNQQWHKSSARFLMAETWRQIKIILGKNQSIAVKRANGKNMPFK
ncbi:crotonase/enoyl-CoA hydratase family protein [Thalassotalea sediminis]|uniref:crotonase/enoyl-CoA hydratase family protein n=1 Tax=Thalassotalea sediminis TaxID=1759089 RepID=UPI002573A4B3|nr:crotonase/enoyl-CoA hydratase family protein [Thalassotalea sediminis]